MDRSCCFSFPPKGQVEMDVEPWDALDLDDSDLPSLLRPCKQLRSTSAAAAAASALSQSSFSQPPEDNHREQQQQLQSQSSTSHHHRAIPGPAGAVQAAMLRKNLDRANNCISNNRDDSSQEITGNCLNNEVISTQDYIRRAVEDTAEFDVDFTLHPWLSAVQFLGAENGAVRSTPIRSMKKCLNIGRVAQVVAVIKSCTPNGLGGLIVSLKDPTCTIGASIHHKVISESEFGKDLTTGAVLILREVAIFAPVRSAHYLNITSRNLVKVFCQDSGSTSNLKNATYPLQYADPGIEYCGNAKRPLKVSSMQNVMIGDMERGQDARKVDEVQNISVIHRQNLFNKSSQPNSGARSSVSASGRGHVNPRNDACNVIPEATTGTSNAADSHQAYVNCSDKGAKLGEDLEGSHPDNAKNTTDSIAQHSCEEIRVNEAQMQKQPSILKTSLPQWTDEQLDQLFADDEDDNSCLF